MNGGCDATDEDRERWAVKYPRPATEGPRKMREEAERLKAAAQALPPEFDAAKRWLEGRASGLLVAVKVMESEG